LAVAGLLALAVGLVGWRGSDLPAAVYRAEIFRRHGFAVWDSQWYGGHATPNYSVLSPMVTALVDPFVLTAVCGLVGAVALDRILQRAFGPVGRIGSVVFAIGTVTNLMVGRAAFGLGAAFGLLAVAALQRDRTGWAVAASLACALSSPVAGLFVGVAASAWWLTRRPRSWRTAVVPAAALVPIAVLGLTFPSAGWFPYEPHAYVFDLAVCVLVGAAAWTSQHRTLVAGAVLYAAAMTGVFVVASPLGGNVSRLGAYVAGPLLVVLLWPRRRVVAGLCLVPLLVTQWIPTLQGGAIAAADPALHASYYQPLVDRIAALGGTTGRLEIPFTHQHWETAYVAPSVPLARGWERQLDLGYNPLFYDGTLTPERYHAWLVDNAVEYVALPDIGLDDSSSAEGAILASQPSFLTEVWRNANWVLWRVEGYRGMVDGPASVVAVRASGLTLSVSAPGDVVVKVRPSPHWSVTAPGCSTADESGWMRLERLEPGLVEVNQAVIGNNC
jgi:hypothetical protein